MNKSLQYIERGGLVILVCVVIALGRFPIELSPLLTGVKNVLLILIILAIGLSGARVFGVGIRMKKTRMLFGFLLLIAGGSIFFILREFFYGSYVLSVPFWYKVSLYSLPAICVEGGLFTLYQQWAERSGATRSVPLDVVFCVYAAAAVGVNFLVLLGLVTIESQLLFSKTIVLVAMSAGIITALYNRSKALV